MKVLHISHSDSLGGADTAAMRLHQALKKEGVDSRMRVRIKTTEDDCIVGGTAMFRSQWSERIAQKLCHWRRQNTRCPDGSELDIAWPSSGLGAEVNSTDCDVVHIHWPGRNWLSIEEIGAIRVPIVWTLHDCWLLRGGEHYEPFSDSMTWLERAARKDQWVKDRKKRKLPKQGHLICPSRWMLKQAQACQWTQAWTHAVIPNPIDTTFWKPLNQQESRRNLGLPSNKFLILFCANNAEIDERKGYRRLVETLNAMKSAQESQREIALVMAGGKKPKLQPDDVTVIALGAIDEEIRMRLVYDSCDVAVIPSYVDNLPNVGLEAQACGLPYLCFNNGGTAEIVDHGRSGFIAADGSTDEMAGYLDKLVDPVNSETLMQMRTMARQRAVELWNERVVARQIIHVYHEALRLERV